MPVNSQNPTLSNSFIGNISNIGSNIPSNNMFPARVLEVNLLPSSDSRSTFQNSGGWFGVGSIVFEPIEGSNSITKFPNGTIAYPLDVNITKIPLVNEIVFIMTAPGAGAFNEQDLNINTYYYTSTINVWNSVNCNPFPSPTNTPKKETNSYKEVEQGFPNQASSDFEEIKLGNTFQTNEKVRNLYPQEGDVLIEGRFGNSIRFTSTNKLSKDFKDVQSPWSAEGQNGSPLTIIRNGQKLNVDVFDEWFPLYEDVDNDDSSIYMTTNQNIPVTLASFNFFSFGINIVPQVKTSAKIERPVKGESGKSNNAADRIELNIDTVTKEPTGALNADNGPSVSPNDLDELSNLSSNSTEFERDEIDLTRSEEIDQQQGNRVI